MASLNFDESIVLILFAQSGGSLAPSHEDVVQFDAGLQKSFGATLQQIMTDEGLEIDVHSRSLVLGCRPHMPGNTPGAQIRRACRYVISAHQALSAAAAVSLAPPQRALAPGTKRGARPRASSHVKRAAPRAKKRRRHARRHP